MEGQSTEDKGVSQDQKTGSEPDCQTKSESLPLLNRSRATTSSDSSVHGNPTPSVSEAKVRQRSYSGSAHCRSLGTTAPFPGYQQWHPIEHHAGQFHPVTGHASQMLTRSPKSAANPEAEALIGQTQGKLRRTASEVVYKLPGPGKLF